MEINNSTDLNDNLHNLALYLSHFTGATGVYIGKLLPPSKPVDDQSEDTSHIIADQPKVIKYIHTTENHTFMLGKTLTPAKGPVTHAVFDIVPTPPENEPLEGDNIAAPKANTDILDTFKHVYVPEVIREPLMSYCKVPRLGSYMAVPLVYESCLSIESLEQAVAD